MKLILLGVIPWALLLNAARKVAYIPKPEGWADLLVAVTMVQLVCLVLAFILAVRR